MKIIVFSDIHGNQYALKASLPLMQQEEAEKAVFLGDVFGYYYGQAECIKILREMPELTCIRGNHDEMYLDLLEGKCKPEALALRYGSSYLKCRELDGTDEMFVRSWPDRSELVLDGCRLGFFHGTPDSPAKGRLYPDTEIVQPELYSPYDVVFLGHTHHKMRRKCGKTAIYNPGSLGQQRDGQGCSYIVFDTVNRNCDFRIVPYDMKPLLQEIKERDNDWEKLKEPLLRQRGRWQSHGL